MLIWRFQAVIVIKHLLISLESFFMIVLVLVQHRDLVRVGPGALSGDQGAGEAARCPGQQPVGDCACRPPRRNGRRSCWSARVPGPTG